MPNRCVVVGCSNTYKTHKMFWFPHAMNEPEKRKMWIKNINREGWVPQDHSFICSKHFVDGKPTALNPYPTMEMGENCPVKKERRRRNKLGVKTIDNKARTIVDPLQPDYHPPRHRRRIKQLNEEIGGSTLATSSRQNGTVKNPKYKNTNCIALLDDVSNIDDVLLTWEAKIKLQLACGFSASENMPVDLVVFEAVRRVENLSLELSRARNLALQLLHKQKSLIVKLITPSGAYLSDHYHYNRKVRIRSGYDKWLVDDDDGEETAVQSQNPNSG